jgi:transposase-like protein
MASRRKYARPFKPQVLVPAKSGQKSISEIERDWKITPGLLHSGRPG